MNCLLVWQLCGPSQISPAAIHLKLPVPFASIHQRFRQRPVLFFIYLPVLPTAYSAWCTLNLRPGTAPPARFAVRSLATTFACGCPISAILRRRTACSARHTRCFASHLPAGKVKASGDVARFILCDALAIWCWPFRSKRPCLPQPGRLKV